MRCSTLLPAAVLALAACEAGSTAPIITPGDPPSAPCTTAQSFVSFQRVGPSFDIVDARPNAVAGRVAANISGDIPRRVAGRASAIEQGRGPGANITIVDAFATDLHGAPTAELFLFTNSAAAEGELQLTPVSLEQLHDSSFIPSGAIAVFADQYDSTAKDYSRWLIAKRGTVNITSVSSGDIGRIGLTISLTGDWVDGSGKQIGCGTISEGVIDAPLLRLRTVSDTLPDTLTAQMSGARTDTIDTGVLTSFQVLDPARSRLLVTGAATPADSMLALWLSLDGIPTDADSIVLGAPTAGEAAAGSADVPFAMLRVSPPSATTHDLWRSTGGYVTLTNIVQMGPLALCGWVSGRYAFDATGTDVEADTALAGTLSVDGTFASRFTVLSPADTLEGAAATSMASRFLSVGAPSPASSLLCPF